MDERPEGISERFDVGESLGSGRAGPLWRALELISATQGVIRRVADEVVPTPRERARLRRELERQAALSGPTIAVPLTTLEAGGALWTFRASVEGPTLRAKLDADGPLSADEALKIVAEIALALDLLHRTGLFHRDVSPDRIVLAESGHAVLRDAGIVAPIVGRPAILGRAEYVAPELVEGRGASFRSDLYALGAVLYEAVTGAPPFGPVGEGDDALDALLRAHATAPRPNVPESLPAPARPLLSQMLAVEPRERPFSAQRVARSLEAYLPSSLREHTRVTRPGGAKTTLVGVPAPIVPPVASSTKARVSSIPPAAANVRQAAELSPPGPKSSPPAASSEATTPAAANAMTYGWSAPRESPAADEPQELAEGDLLDVQSLRTTRPPPPLPVNRAPSPSTPPSAAVMMTSWTKTATAKFKRAWWSGRLAWMTLAGGACFLVGVTWLVATRTVEPPASAAPPLTASAPTTTCDCPVPSDVQVEEGAIQVLPNTLGSDESAIVVVPTRAAAAPAAPAVAAPVVAAAAAPPVAEPAEEVADVDEEPAAPRARRGRRTRRTTTPSPTTMTAPAAPAPSSSRTAAASSASSSSSGSSSAASSSRSDPFEQAISAARAAFQSRDYDQAEASYLRASRIRSNDAGVFAGLGAARLAQRDARGAVEAYRRAINLSPRTAGYHAALGRAYDANGEEGNARRAYEAALRIDPHNAAARRGLASL